MILDLTPATWRDEDLECADVLVATQKWEEVTKVRTIASAQSTCGEVHYRQAQRSPRTRLLNRGDHSGVRRHAKARPNLEPVGHPERNLDDPTIQKQRSNFQRRGNACAVHLHKSVIYHE
jgi:hypothetical protein